MNTTVKFYNNQSLYLLNNVDFQTNQFPKLLEKRKPS